MKSLAIRESPWVGTPASNGFAYIVPDRCVIVFADIQIVVIGPERGSNPHEAPGPGPHDLLGCFSCKRRLETEI